MSATARRSPRSCRVCGFRAAPAEAGRRATHRVAPTRPGAGGFVINGVDVLNLANWHPRMVHSDAT